LVANSPRFQALRCVFIVPRWTKTFASTEPLPRPYPSALVILEITSFFFALPPPLPWFLCNVNMLVFCFSAPVFFNRHNKTVSPFRRSLRDVPLSPFQRCLACPVPPRLLRAVPPIFSEVSRCCHRCFEFPSPLSPYFHSIHSFGPPPPLPSGPVSLFFFPKPTTQNHTPTHFFFFFFLPCATVYLPTLFSCVF